MSAPYDTPLIHCNWCGKIFNTDEDKDCPYCKGETNETKT